MTDDKPTPGTPLSVDAVADLHAGVLDEATVARLWPRVLADPQARAVLDALDATGADLSALGSAQVGPLPGEVATRIDAALAQERRSEQGVAGVVGINPARRRRSRLLASGAGIITTVAAAAVAVAVLSPGSQVQQTPNVARPAPGATAGADDSPLTLRGGNLDSAVGAVVGVREFGPLGGEARLDACLAANGIDPNVRPAGVRPALIDGQRAVVVLYPTGEFAQYRLIALSADCGRNNPGLLKDTIIGRR